MHRAHLQRVKIIYNTPATLIAEKGQLGEITVPYTDSMHFTQNFGWTPTNRLYYGTVHWIVGIDEGPDKQPWYRLRDELNSANYNVPAIHIRLISEAELAPITPDVPFNQKRIEVQISSQTLTCFEFDKIVLQTEISSGLPSTYSGEGIPTATPKGDYNVQVKMPSKHMGDGNLTSDLHAYELVGVPWNCFFTLQGHAFHGAYWHDNFGIPMSHGCINMRISDAKWLFLWTMPVAKPGQESTINYGTSIHIY
jgi:lipoprotein-anchoring transpeptidase ErfK/SrfK